MDDSERSWISKFCRRRGNEFFCKIDREFIENEENWSILENRVLYYPEALDLILDEDDHHYVNNDYLNIDIKEASAKWVYGILHAKFILTEPGMKKMIIKYYHRNFGRCPRAFCDNQPMLPLGLSEVPRVAMVKLYCPKCMDIYYPRSIIHYQTDGAFFGTKFPYRLLEAHPEVSPQPYGGQLIKTFYGYKINNLPKY